MPLCACAMSSTFSACSAIMLRVRCAMCGADVAYRRCARPPGATPRSQTPQASSENPNPFLLRSCPSLAGPFQTSLLVHRHRRCSHSNADNATAHCGQLLRSGILNETEGKLLALAGVVPFSEVDFPLNW